MKRLSVITLFLVVGFCGSSMVFAKDLHVPEDHPSVQAAINAAEAGDTVWLAAGIYKERIVLTEGITLRSTGDDQRGQTGLRRAEATVIDGGGRQGQGPGITMAQGCVLDGVTVTNVGLYDDAEWNKHHATQGNDQPHEHIGHFGAPGIGVVGVNCTITNCIVHHNGDTGIGIRKADSDDCSPRITANVCYRNMGGGIGSMDGSTAIIDGNTCFQNFYAGIGHSAASPIVTNNTCYENIRAGIGVSDGASPVVKANRCYDNRRAGIGVRTGHTTSPVVENNDCYSNDMAGIGCEEHSTPIIRHNRCHHNAMAGIGSQSGAAPVIVGNTCYENDSAGIGIQDEVQAVIVDNECRENKTTGIGVRSGATAVVCGNRCIENRLVAVGLPDGATAVLADNELVRTGGMPPLVAINGGSTALLSNNTLSGGGVAGLLLEGRAIVSGNRFQAKGRRQGSAVWVRAGSVAAIHDNSFNDYRHAVNATGSAVSVTDNTVTGFQQTAIIVRQSSQPAHVFGNTAVSNIPTDNAVIVEGPAGILADNNRVPAEDK
jgi:parallel beta-helix repeat protein